METLPSDISGECLVTDLVHELSSRLEIPLLLDDNIRVPTKVENISPLDTAFYEEQIKETWKDDPYFNFVTKCDSTLYMKDNIKEDVDCFLEFSKPIESHSGNAFSGSGSGSGSECSSTEIWMNKSELDTPPITPPDDRLTSENIYLLPSDELSFIPICREGSPQEGNNLDNNFKSISKRVRIQPKPVPTSVNIFDSKAVDFHTVMCNVFNDVNSVNKGNHDLTLESKLLLDFNTEKKRSFLSKKDFELQAKRKQERMIRNRESAYLSRKRKKEHVAHLEKQVQELQIENKQLKTENHNLRQRLAKYEKLEPYPEKKIGTLFTESPRKTTALLALLFTVCLNIGSFSSLINERRMFKSNTEVIREDLVPSYGSELRNSRSLLWANNDFESLNSTYSNLTKTSCPLSVNQTESIRLESELRRWIGGDEESGQTKHNVSKISQYFLSGERPKQRKSVSRQKRRLLRPDFHKKNLGVYQMNLLYFNTFFEAIHRRDDTFYLVSFSSDHLLLPALSHNQTSRPKMSLMLPASFSNGTGLDQVEMMQIDCEVTNTQLLSVNENDIPSHMKPYANFTDSKNNTDPKAKGFEKYFMNDLPVTLVPAKKNNFKTERNDLPYLDSPKNQTERHFEPSPSQNTRRKLFATGEMLNLPHTNFQRRNFNKSLSKDENPSFPHSFSNKTSNVFFNQTKKPVNFVTNTKKNLLKWLLLGYTASDPGAVKFAPEKPFYKSLKNITKFLLN